MTTRCQWRGWGRSPGLMLGVGGVSYHVTYAMIRLRVVIIQFENQECWKFYWFKHNDLMSSLQTWYTFIRGPFAITGHFPVYRGKPYLIGFTLQWLSKCEGIPIEILWTVLGKVTLLHLPDFSDEIANLTLAEKPNALYKSSRSWMARYDTTSTDSEEVDSDSGYSSPLHRRKQASSGTHPVAGHCPGNGLPLGFRPKTSKVMLPLNASSAITAQHSTSAVSLAAASQLNSSLYAAYLQSGIGHGKLSSRAAPGSYPASGGTSGYTGGTTGYPSNPPCYNQQSYPPLASGVATGMGKATGSGSSTTPSTDDNYPNSYGIPANSNLSTNIMANVTRSVTKQTGLITKTQTQTTQLAKNVTTSKSEPEQQTEELSAGWMRWRRRSRRRRRDLDDAGALSDEPFDLSRANSRSYVTRCSTDVNTDSVLPFEDEDEFPDLRASAHEDELRGGFVSDTGRKSSTLTAFLSYSDILKKQTVSEPTTPRE